MAVLMQVYSDMYVHKHAGEWIVRTIGDSHPNERTAAALLVPASTEPGNRSVGMSLDSSLCTHGNALCVYTPLFTHQVGREGCTPRPLFVHTLVRLHPERC